MENIKKKWEDLRSRTKQKAVTINKEHVATGGGKKLRLDLNTVERRILSLMGETAIAGPSGGVDTANKGPVMGVKPSCSQVRNTFLLYFLNYKLTVKPLYSGYPYWDG